MGTDVERGSDSIKSAKEDDLQVLESEFRDLQEKTQELISERTHLESELRSVKKQASRLEEEVRHLRSPPLIIGTLQDVLDPERAIVRSSNGTVFQVALNQRIEPSLLKPGTRVALNQDTLSVIEVLSDAWDPIVSGSEMVEKPDTTYEMVAGLDEEILSVREAIELPLLKPHLFEKVGIKAPKGVLLVGPPGCGKTLLAKAVAHHTNATFIRMVGSELAQKYIGEGGRLVRELFSLAKEKSPTIIFLDEIDAIGAKRLDGSTSGDREVQRTLMQLLAELDGFDQLENVKIIAATNRPDILDDALLRPGRFDRVIEIPIPNTTSLLLGTDRQSVHTGPPVEVPRITNSGGVVNASPGARIANMAYYNFSTKQWEDLNHGPGSSDHDYGLYSSTPADTNFIDQNDIGFSPMSGIIVPTSERIAEKLLQR